MDGGEAFITSLTISTYRKPADKVRSALSAAKKGMKPCRLSCLLLCFKYNRHFFDLVCTCAYITHIYSIMNRYSVFYIVCYR